MVNSVLAHGGFCVSTRAGVHCEFSRLRQRTSPTILLVDNFADYAEQVEELLAEVSLDTPLLVISSERAYRREHIDVVLSDVPLDSRLLGEPTANELDQLLEKYQTAGLVGQDWLTGNRTQAIRRLRGDPIAIAVCRILNDFRPLDRIVDSLWTAASPVERQIYLAAALAQRCHGAGVRQSVLQLIAGSQFAVDDLIGTSNALPLARHPADGDFVLPRSAVVAERILTRVARQHSDLILEAFVSLASHVAPRVNRKAIGKRSPEARLAGRLFDADKVVRPLLSEAAEDFYEAVKEAWKWNSRYWEQRALLIADRDIRTALQYARHAVTIEVHPLPLTTLGKTLLLSMGTRTSDQERASVFAEAFAVLNRAISIEARNARIAIQPFATLLNGTAKYLADGGALTLIQNEVIRRYMEDARLRYGEDVGIAAAIRRLDAAM